MNYQVNMKIYINLFNINIILLVYLLSFIYYNINMNKPTLCLKLMITSYCDITNLIKSVLPIIDSYIIYDNITNHEYIELLKDKPGIIVNVNTDFVMSDYSLLLESNMNINISNFNKDLLLEGEAFFISEIKDDIEYCKLRIKKNNSDLNNISGVALGYHASLYNYNIINNENIHYCNYNGFPCHAGQVDGLVHRIIDELEDLYPDATDVTVIATGGLAPLIKGIAETIDVFEPDLTLIGLRLIHERNL